ncbi:MAG TPA: MBL fold metallo-hydrolase [Puia sp.]|nr:MBL fold metallo-hydrolase [Puia sp.]
MIIEQFEDRHLSHYSYAILHEEGREIILIDPSRNIALYTSFAARYDAKIIGVVETHPHADFVSSHLELHQSTGTQQSAIANQPAGLPHTHGATIYASQLTGAAYPHQAFDEGDTIRLGNLSLRALNTPGHSPDSICIVLQQEGKDLAVFTGDTLFIGDCGRPDLREKAGSTKASRLSLAGQMYHSLRKKLMTLNDDVTVYPAHGAGTLCGKSLSPANSSTIGAEKNSNWCLQPMTEEEFITELLTEQPFIPKYFAYDVELNKTGAPPLQDSLRKIPITTWDAGTNADSIPVDSKLWIVDTRDQAKFAAGHLQNSVNIMQHGRFETWLGSIIAPHEQFCLVAESSSQLQEMMERTAAIGYEPQITRAFILAPGLLTTPLPQAHPSVTSIPPLETSAPPDLEHFNPREYTIVDVRNVSERKVHPIFEDSLGIPLGELRERLDEIPMNKPVAVHCAGGYRSAAGSSLLQTIFKDNIPVFDIGEAIKSFQ